MERLRVDGNRFDRLVRSLSASETRRGLLQLLAAIAGFFSLLPEAGEAGQGSGGRKGGKHHGRNRTRSRHARRRGHGHRKKKPNTPNLPTTCSPESPDGPCGADQLCVDGACQPCTVTCSGDPSSCGAALQAAIDAAGAAMAGPVVVCPGRYAGNFVITAGVELIGSGDGDDPSNSTILDAQGAGRVLVIPPGGAGEVAMARLRLTGGGGPNGLGGGIVNFNNRTLTMTRCTVSGNQTTNPGNGGGIFNDGTMTLVDCRIEDNRADHGGGISSTGGHVTTLRGNTQVRGNTAVIQGGGIFVFPGGAVTIDAGCQVTENTAPAGQGGGIHSDSSVSTVALANDQIVTDNNGGNCAGADIDNCDG